jgi:uncharacterized protein YjbI with pentapeptide repeats
VLVEQVQLVVNNQQASSDSVQPSSTPIPKRPAWRTEPEIDAERQQFLRQRLTIVPDIQQAIYPFKDVRLTRADVEWLLITHEQGHGPVDWSDPSQSERQGIDLRGADLSHVNLRGLPLARLCGGMTQEEWIATTLEQRTLAGVHLEHADLSDAHLEGAILRGAFLQNASFRQAHLEQAVLFQAHVEQAYLRRAHLEGANLMYAHLEGTYFRKAWLTGADLRHAICDNATTLEKVTLNDRKWRCVLLADVHWDDCNLSILDWRHSVPLGDETLARSLSIQADSKKSLQEKHRHLDTYQAAARANRQLANAMRAQGMNDESIPFAYRAQVLQRAVLWRRLLWGMDAFPVERRPHHGFRRNAQKVLRRIGMGAAYLFSWFLDMLAGYGYKPERSLGIYMLTILFFTLIYLFAGALPFGEALVFSVTAFHGRGFLPGPFTLASPITALAALEAVIGLFIEISFIATFTQRFFGR